MDITFDSVVIPWYRQETCSAALAANEESSQSIDPTLFLTWCSENDMLPNAEARAGYAREVVAGRADSAAPR